MHPSHLSVWRQKHGASCGQHTKQRRTRTNTHSHTHTQRHTQKRLRRAAVGQPRACLRHTAIALLFIAFAPLKVMMQQAPALCGSRSLTGHRLVAIARWLVRQRPRFVRQRRWGELSFELQPRSRMAADGFVGEQADGTLATLWQHVADHHAHGLGAAALI